LGTRWRYRFGAEVVTPSVRLARIVLYRLRTKWFRFTETRRALGRRYFYRSLPSAYRFHWAVERLTDEFAASLAAEDDSNGD
jgi:hypothetical protein